MTAEPGAYDDWADAQASDFTTLRRPLVVDGVAYMPARIRELIRERHQLVAELALVRDTLRRRTDALNATSAENERLRELRVTLSGDGGE